MSYDVMMKKSLSHIDSDGQANMVDVGHKTESERVAIVTAKVRCNQELMAAVNSKQIRKGNIIEVARIAGIMAAKRTHDLIPLCHPLPLDHIEVDINVDDDGFTIKSMVKTYAKTGVEMEAMTAASICALTIYDMGKAIDKSILIQNIQLLKKTGGKSGDYIVASD